MTRLGLSGTPIKHLAREVRELNLDLAEDNLLSLSYGRVVRKDINSNDGLLPKSFERYTKVQAGDTVLRLTDLQNDQRSLRTGRVSEAGIITSAYLSLRPSNACDSRFLAYCLHAMDVGKVFYALGGGLRQSMGMEEVGNLRIPLPPLEEQRRIADFLDDRITRIDAIAGARDEQCLAVGGAAASLAGDLVASLPRRGAPMSAIVRIVDTEHKTAPDAEVGGYFIAGTNSIRRGRIIDAELREIDERTYRDWTRRATPLPGDVVLTREAPIGQVALLEGEGDMPAIGQRVVLLRPNSDLHPEYLRLILASPRLGELVATAAAGSLHPHLNMSDIARLRIPVVSLSDQERLGRAFSDGLSAIEQLEASVLFAKERMAEYRRSLITAAVTGELDVTTTRPEVPA